MLNFILAAIAAVLLAASLSPKVMAKVIEYIGKAHAGAAAKLSAWGSLVSFACCIIGLPLTLFAGLWGDLVFTAYIGAYIYINRHGIAALARKAKDYVHNRISGNKNKQS